MSSGRKLSWLVRSAGLVSVWMTLRELGDDDCVPVGCAHSVQPTLHVSRVRHSWWRMCGLQALVDHTYCLCSSGRYLLLIAAGFVSTTAEETNDGHLAKLQGYRWAEEKALRAWLLPLSFKFPLTSKVETLWEWSIVCKYKSNVFLL